MSRFFDLPDRSKPGLFITGTDTGVGKTVVTCAIADVLVRMGQRVGVCKPFATGCRTDRGNLISSDAEALAHFAQMDPNIGDLGVVTPIRHIPPVAPAVAMELAGQPLDVAPIGRAMRAIDDGTDIVLVEGVGGLMVPLDPQRPDITVLDLAREMGYPVVVVTRCALGTLNHTALTCRVLREAGCRLAGLVINFYKADDPDPAMQTNRQWLIRMNRADALATIPHVEHPRHGGVPVQEGLLQDEVRAAVALTNWLNYAEPPRITDDGGHIDDQRRFVFYYGGNPPRT